MRLEISKFLAYKSIQVDELILDIIGRDKCTPAPDILNDDNLQTLLGFITKNDPHSNGIQFNKADSLHNSSPYSIHDSDEKQNGYMKSNSPMMNGHAQSPANESVMELHPKLPEVITSLFQSFATNNPPTTTTTQNSFNLSQNNMKRKRPNTDDPIDDDSLDDIDEQKLKKRKLHAEIRLLNAQVLVQEREATLKDLQIMALKRELDLPPTAQSAQNRSFSKEDV